jgi:hypothetical protein
MATTKGTHSGARLGTRLRGKLAEAYSVRGHHKSSLWYVYSPRTDRDWVLKSDLEWGHFLLAESDPRVCTIDYAPAPEIVRVGDENHSTVLDAIVTFKDDDVVEWREIKSSESIKNLDIRTQHQWEAQVEAASQKGVRYVRFTEQEIFACPQRIANWSRIIAWLSAVRGRSLYSQHLEVAALLNARGSVSLGEIHQLGSGPESACYIAAALKGVQDALFISDLDEKPLNKNTLIKSVESRT